MLSALLPGVREVRTPLVTGLLWAACFWILFGPRIADSEGTREFVRRLSLEELPSAAWFGAGALLVYLVGGLLVVRESPIGPIVHRTRPRVSDWVDRLDEDRKPARLHHRLAWQLWRRQLGHRKPGNLMRRWGSHDDVVKAVDAWLHNQFDAMAAEGRIPVMRSFEGGCNAPYGFEAYYATDTLNGHPAFTEDFELKSYLAQCFVQEVHLEQPAVEVRIQMRFPEVYAEIDRLKAESELRLSIFWPLLLLSALLAWAWSPVALLLLTFPLFLLRDGFKRAHDASEKTWSPLVSGDVTSPILDAMASAKDEPCRDFATRFHSHEEPAAMQ